MRTFELTISYDCNTLVNTIKKTIFCDVDLCLVYRDKYAEKGKLVWWKTEGKILKALGFDSNWGIKNIERAQFITLTKTENEWEKDYTNGAL